MNSYQATLMTQFKIDTLWLVFRFQESNFEITGRLTVWLTVINEIFKFPPRLDPFGQENYLYELLSRYPNDPIKKWYIWASFQTARKGFRKLQKAIWLTVINEIFTFLPQLDSFGQENYL